ncbi:HTTM domain-containing protein [Georgenia wangjunii]|uniref:HTTM domain-containing protein n=1 Tax=Georgenia wangjunii TaxID=3117730 RepID=UPI002F264A85
MSDVLRAGLTPVAEAKSQVEAWMLAEKRALYGLSFSRILVGTALLGILVTNFGMRHATWGHGSSWIEPHRARAAFGELHEVFTVGGPAVFTAMYLALAAVACGVILGWRTRLSVLVLAVGMTALVERNGFVGDQGDNIARIGLVLMLFMNVSEHWSLDARRRRRATADGAPPTSVPRRLLAGLPVLPAWMTNLLHNSALIALALQLFTLYIASAMFKIQGEVWQDGTALYYPLSIPEFSVLPVLNSVMTTNAVMVTVATYFAVYVQLFFPALLLNAVTRRIALLGIIAMHVGIAVLMGLPWFSLSMIAFDAIFVSRRTFVALERLVLRVVTSLRLRLSTRRTRVGGAGRAPRPAAVDAAG